MKKTAVILFNLGGPDSLEAVRPFLFNLFTDPAIIRLPTPLRQFVAWMISSRREKTAQEIYGKIGGRSPILPNTEAQARALEEKLNATAGGSEAVAVARSAEQSHPQYKVFIAMRYWHPFATETIKQVKEYAPDDMVLLPLYPQFSTTTSDSSLKEWVKVTARAGLGGVPSKTVCCYPTNSGFISALVDVIRPAYARAHKFGNPRLLFSAHGLPEKIVLGGDPYQYQCEQTVTALVQALALPDMDYTICYQSRVGPLKWIGPSTEDEVRQAGADKVPVVMVPIAFVSEHSETLVELDIEYRQLAHETGVPHYACVPTVSTNGSFISALANMVVRAKDGCAPDTGARLCPPDFAGCACRAKI